MDYNARMASAGHSSTNLEGTARQTGQAVSFSDRQLRALVDTIPGLVWLARVDGGAEYANRRWLEYTGLSQADAAGWGWTVAIHRDDLERLTNYWRNVLQSGGRGQTPSR